MNFGQNLYNWFLSNAQSLVLMAIAVIGVCERRIGYSYVRTGADTKAKTIYDAWKKALGE